MTKIENQPLETLLKCAVWSPYLTPDLSFSVIIVADSQLYKTGTLMKFSHVRGVSTVTDITYRDFVSETLGEFERGKYKTIIIPDLLKAIKKKESTKANFLTLMNALIEEGVFKVYGGKDFGGVRANLLTSITPDIWKETRSTWYKIGFANRILPFTYKYDKNRANEVYHAIGEYSIKRSDKINVDLPLTDTRIEVTIDKKQTIIAEKVSKKIIETEGYWRFNKTRDGKMHQKFIGEEYAFRHKWHIQSLLKSLALIGNRRSVNEDDIKSLNYLSKWMNYEFNPL